MSNIGKIWKKLMLITHIIAVDDDPHDCVACAPPYSHCAVLKYAANTGRKP